MNTKQIVNITDIQHLDNADLTAEFSPSLNREGWAICSKRRMLLVYL